MSMLLANEIVATALADGGVPTIYRVHGSPDEDKLSLFSQLASSLGYADAKPRSFQNAPKDRHREARMIDVGVARHEDDVDAVPAAIARFPDLFEPFFGTPHDYAFEDAARMFDIRYEHPSTREAFEAAYDAACARSGATLIEVHTHRKLAVKPPREA